MLDIFAFVSFSHLDTCSNMVWQMHTAWARPLRWGHSSDAKKKWPNLFSAHQLGWSVSIEFWILFLFFCSFSIELRNSNNHNIFILHSCETKHRCDSSQYPKLFAKDHSVFMRHPRRTFNNNGRRTHNVIFDLFDRNPININIACNF